MGHFNKGLGNKLEKERHNNFKKSELEQADDEADHHIYAGSADSVEEFKKELNDED